MIGILQILIYLLCIYLVFKGVDILQLAISSSTVNKHGGLALGLVALLSGIAGAIYFAIWVDKFAAEISSVTQPLGGGP